MKAAHDKQATLQRIPHRTKTREPDPDKPDHDTPWERISMSNTATQQTLRINTGERKTPTQQSSRIEHHIADLHKITSPFYDKSLSVNGLNSSLKIFSLMDWIKKQE